MKNKTDAELIEEAEKLFSKPIPWKYESLSELAILASELARRLKAANERLAEMGRCNMCGKTLRANEGVRHNHKDWCWNCDPTKNPRPLSKAEMEELGAEYDKDL